MKTLIFQLCFIAFVLLFNFTNAVEYVKLNKDDVAIKFNANSNSTTIAKGVTGDIFELVETKGEWYGVNMFSGEYRYILKIDADKITTIPPLTTSAETKKKIYKELIVAEDKALKEAESKYPNDFDKQIDLQRILEDRYKLLVFRKYEVAPPYYSKIISEGTKNRY